MRDQKKTKSELIRELNSLRDKSDSGWSMGKDDEIYEKIVNQAREMIFQVDTDFKFIYFNKYAENLTGYKNTEWQGKPFAPIVHPEDLNHVIFETQKTLNGDRIDFETRILDASGKTIWLNVQAIPNFDGEELSYILCFAQDITQRKKVEHELTESNRRFRQIFHNVPVSIWEEDWKEVIQDVSSLKKQGVTDFKKYFSNHPEFVKKALKKVIIKDVNQESLRLFNAGNKKELVNSLETIFSTPDTLPGFEKELLALAEGKTSFNSEMDLRTIDNKLIHILLTMSFPQPEDGTGEVLVSLMDITDRNEMEEGLRQSEAKFRQVFENSPLGKSMTGIDGSLNTNKAFAQILGYTKEELNGVKWKQITHPDDVEKNKKQIDAILKGNKESANFEKRYFHKKGHVIWADVNTSLISNSQEKPLYFITTISDITRRKEAEKKKKVQAEEKEKLLRERGERMKELKCIYSLSESFRKRESIDKLLWDVVKFVPQGYNYPDIAKIRVAFDEMVKSSKGLKETPWKQSAGIYQNNKKRGQIEVFYTEEKQALDEGPFLKEERELLQNIANNLSEAIKSLSSRRELQRAVKELERSNQELEQFAYVASHDLQEPLRMVSSYTQLLQRRYKNQIDEKADKYIHYAVDGASRMQGLINDLLSYSRVTTKGQPFGITDMHEALGKAIVNLQSAIRENQAIVTNDDLPVITADATQMHLVFQNLISNAIKYRKNDEHPRIHISARKEENDWIFSISDNGIGIDEKYKDRLFTIFQRLHTSKEYSGSGIGLAISKRIINRHGGTIWFNSEPGKGTTFYFTMPESIEESQVLTI